MIYLYLLLLSLASAQSRYIDPIFEEIQITKNVVYGKASNPPLEGWPSFIEKSIYQTQDIMSEIENIQELIDQLENQANDYFVVNELLEEFDNLKEMLAPVITAEISKALKNIDSINKSMNPKQKKTIKNWNSNIKILKVQLNDMMGSFKMAMADKKFNELVKNIEYFSNNQSNIVDSLKVLSENELQSLLDNQKKQVDRLNNIKISLNEISNIIEAFYPDLSKKIKNIEESSLVFSISKKLDATTLAIQNKNKKLSAANASNVNLKIYNLSIIINESKLLFDKKISKEKIANYQTDLKMDIYEAAADTVSIRPVIIFLHSGAFVAGDKEADVMVELSKEAAKKGYVAVSANYRWL